MGRSSIAAENSKNVSHEKSNKLDSRNFLKNYKTFPFKKSEWVAHPLQHKIAKKSNMK